MDTKDFVLFSFNSTEAEDLAKKLRLRFYPTSVKENLNVEEGEDHEANTTVMLAKKIRWPRNQSWRERRHESHIERY